MMKELNREGYSILELCSFAGISRSSYYKWLNKVETLADKENSVIRKKRKRYIKSTPQITADNILNRNFIEASPNKKWLTDVTEFKLSNGAKAYLSAILDLGDNSIISYVLGHSNNNKLVFDTFDLAVQDNPTAKPLFHSDRGFQYTSKIFKIKAR